MLPEGGLQKLREKLKLGWKYFDALAHLAQAGAPLTRAEEAYGQRFVIASMWVVAENARPKAIEKLKLTGNQFICCI